MIEDPGAAADHAAPGPARVRAWLLAGHPERARAHLHAERPRMPDEQRLRLRAEVWTAAGDPGAERAISKLEAELPGWEGHADGLRTRIHAAVSADRWTRVGLALFASALALLALGGSRALLKPRGLTVLTLSAGLVAYGVARLFAPRAIGVVLLLGAGLGALVHAADAARVRTAAGPRIRTLLVALVLLGVFGQVLAVGAHIGFRSLWSAVERLEASFEAS